MSKPKIVALSGSAAQKSYNSALLRAIGSLLPETVEFELFEDIKALPFYSPDLDNQNAPEVALRFRQTIKEADAIIIASPEYNYSFTGQIKNALDWASRPYGKHVLIAKPVVLASASTGILGGVRGQLHLREVLHATGSLVLSRPEIFVTSAAQKFNSNLELTDESTWTMLEQAVEALIVHADLKVEDSAA
ncbi:NADPH-dependent FMN reductase [Acidithrix ferrooxidans]|uniref:NADPH azoreductase n=1 Tax=Acidithrix ferrooxidans TaxID=1280514 RepID=A0A0D8HEQ3_9ACTN|nr:NAD(P)H-dependent oxidoreductase [Acidithrix ferrooxidans]KJF15536.1 NADPH azoreductase [Acidithrix ferrooxidans]